MPSSDHMLAAWSDAVRDSPLPVALLDIANPRIIELSPSMARLLGTTREEAIGRSYLDFVPNPDVTAEGVRLLRDGIVSRVVARRPFPGPDGSIEVTMSGWAIRSAEGTALWLADTGLPAATGGDPDAEPGTAPGAHVTLGTLDSAWRIVDASGGGDNLVGRPHADLIGTSLTDLADRSDLGGVLLALAGATTEGASEARLRLRHVDGRPRVVAATFTLRPRDGDVYYSFAFAEQDDGDPAQVGRIEQLERHLRRIAAEVHEAGVFAPAEAPVDLAAVPELRELSSRQWEVAMRLMRGQRVPTIAQEMFLSSSTVRNHLVAIFRKFGVHSQSELLLRLRQAGDPSMTK
jgi:PAS domain S-box-containing protein